MFKILVTLSENVVTGIRQVGQDALEVSGDILVDEYDVSLLGKTWDGTDFIETPAPPESIVPNFSLGSLVITRNNGLPIPQNGNKYYLDVGDTVEVVGTIQGGESIDAPIIKLPITRHADDLPTADELYFTGNIVSGVMTVSGVFNQSSNYKALMSRCNRALDRLPAGFHVSFDDIDFLV